MTKYMGNDPIHTIRIQGKHDDKIGHNVSIYDADSNEAIGNIFQVIVLINAADINKAIVTYYKKNVKCTIEAVDGEPVEITEELDCPEIDVTALPVPATVLTKVAELWEIAEELARLGADPRHCPFCNPKADSLEPDELLHQSRCPMYRATKITREG